MAAVCISQPLYNCSLHPLIYNLPPQISNLNADELAKSQFSQGNQLPRQAIKWHNLRIVPSESGQQELVIQKLENLQDSAKILVKKGSGGFQIGILEKTQDELNGTSFAKKQSSSSQRSDLLNKLKLRGQSYKNRLQESFNQPSHYMGQNSSGQRQQANQKETPIDQKRDLTTLQDSAPRVFDEGSLSVSRCPYANVPAAKGAQTLDSPIASRKKHKPRSLVRALDYQGIRISQLSENSINFDTHSQESMQLGQFTVESFSKQDTAQNRTKKLPRSRAEKFQNLQKDRRDYQQNRGDFSLLIADCRNIQKETSSPRKKSRISVRLCNKSVNCSIEAERENVLFDTVQQRLQLVSHESNTDMKEPYQSNFNTVKESEHEDSQTQSQLRQFQKSELENKSSNASLLRQGIPAAQQMPKAASKVQVSPQRDEQTTMQAKNSLFCESPKRLDQNRSECSSFKPNSKVQQIKEQDGILEQNPKVVYETSVQSKVFQSKEPVNQTATNDGIEHSRELDSPTSIKTFDAYRPKAMQNSKINEFHLQLRDMNKTMTHFNRRSPRLQEDGEQLGHQQNIEIVIGGNLEGNSKAYEEADESAKNSSFRKINSGISDAQNLRLNESFRGSQNHLSAFNAFNESPTLLRPISEEKRVLSSIAEGTKSISNGHDNQGQDGQVALNTEITTRMEKQNEPQIQDENLIATQTEETLRNRQSLGAILVEKQMPSFSTEERKHAISLQPYIDSNQPVNLTQLFSNTEQARNKLPQLKQINKHVDHAETMDKVISDAGHLSEANITQSQVKGIQSFSQSIDARSHYNQTQPLPQDMLLRRRQQSEVQKILKSGGTNQTAELSQGQDSPSANKKSVRIGQTNQQQYMSNQSSLDWSPTTKIIPEKQPYPLKYFKGQDLELYYMEKQLKPGVEREIKEGFFEIKKKFTTEQQDSSRPQDQTQVYVSHLCLHNYHPIFCKFSLDAVKTVLGHSQIIYLKPQQVLYSPDYNERHLYIILFGKLLLKNPQSQQRIGQPLNLGWTVGEEILFRPPIPKHSEAHDLDHQHQTRPSLKRETCESVGESCVLGIEKGALGQIKRKLVQSGQTEEFVKLEVVLRGNYLVKQAWRK